MPKVVTTRTGKKQVILHPSTVRSGGVKNIIFDELEETPRNVKPKLTSSAGEGSATVNLIEALEDEFNPDALPSLGEFLGESDNMAAKGKKRSKSKSKTSTKRTRSKSSTKKTSSRRSKSRSMTPKALSGPVAKNIAGLLNPFAHSDGVQIPDGAVPHSMGRFFRNVFQVEAPFFGTRDFGEKDNDGTTHICILPGLHFGVMHAINRPAMADEEIVVHRYSHDKQRVTGRITSSKWDDKVSGYYNTIPPTNAEILKMNNDSGSANPPAGHVPKGINEPFGRIQLAEDIVKWRIASQGMRLKLLNAQDNNDGWFEAIRINYKIRNKDWKLKGWMRSPDGGISWESTEDNNFFKGLRFGPTDLLIDEYENVNWAENKSYICDSLKNIHKYQFNLETYTGQNSFQDMRHAYEVHRVLDSENEYLSDNPDKPWPTQLQTDYPVAFPLCEGEEDATEFARCFVDKDHDVVMIRIHPGRGSTVPETGDGVNPDPNAKPINSAVLLCEHVCNQEIVYETESEKAAFMRDAPVDSAAADKAMDIKKSNADGFMAVS